MEKEITFFYTEEVEKWAVESIYSEAQKKGYKVKFSEDLSENCEIGFYCQDKYTVINSKLSIVMNHGMDQARLYWPNRWNKEPWNKYDIGFLPGKSWSDMWRESSWDPFSYPKKGIYETGWPKSDKVFKKDFEQNINDFKKELNLENKKTILYAPNFEVDNKQIETLDFLKNLDVNVLVKHWITEKDAPKFQDLNRNINEANLYTKKNFKNCKILDPNLDIIQCLAVSDILITDESSVLYEAFLFNIPCVSISDWTTKTSNHMKSRKINPSKETYKVVKKKEFKKTIVEILNNIKEVNLEIEQKKNFHYSNHGKSSEIIISIIDNIVENKIYENQFKIKPKYKKNLFLLVFRPLKNFLLKFILGITPLKFIKFFSNNKILKEKFNQLRNY
tara:strand:- start:1594 stop:2763 length:1170 start_codon:yes stop_codon:yes gene_type:complete